MLHAAPPLEAGGSSAPHHRCLLRDRGGHGAIPADPYPLYGDDAATTRFLLERVLRGGGLAPLPYLPSPAPSSADAIDFDPAEREDSAKPTSGIVPSGGAGTSGSSGGGTSESSGGGTAPATELHRPLESAASAPVSRLPAILGPEGRILIVANCLPVTAKPLGENQWDFVESSGGLVSALRGVTGVQLMWVGWPGVSIPDKEDQTIVMNKLMHMRCIPVFLDEELVEQYYSGYCNNILWPLFHYMGMPQDHKFKKKNFKSQLTAYDKANQMFADTVCKIYKEGDIVWCHDYHLMFLPMLLKNFNSNMKVGWLDDSAGNGEAMRCYVVYIGRVPGVYEEWKDCAKQVNNFSGNLYQGYASREVAEEKWRKWTGHGRKKKWRSFIVIITALLLGTLVGYVLYSLS